MRIKIKSDLKLRFLIHTATAHIWTIYVTKLVPYRIVYRETRTYHVKIFFHRAN